MAGDKRPKRRCVKKQEGPSGAHYVGYVEDEETPEAIMRKFAIMEQMAADKRVKDEAGPAEGSPAPCTAPEGTTEDPDTADAPMFDEDELAAIQKATGTFSVRHLLDTGFDLQDSGDGWGEEDGEFDDDGEGYEDEDVEDGEWGTRAKSHRAQRAQRGFGARQIRVKLPGQAAGGPSNNIMFMGMRQGQVGARGPLIRHIRLPPRPMPPSWAQTIRPYTPAGTHWATRKPELPPNTRLMFAPSVPEAPWSSLKTEFQGLLISPGWEYVHEDPAEQLRQLRAIPVRKLVPHGFVFCWAQKWNAQALVKWLTGQDYRLVENLTWAFLQPNNGPRTFPAGGHGAVFLRSHMTMYIFRHNSKEGSKIELRHQRHADYTQECPRPAPGMPVQNPQAAWDIIETLLPGGPGKFLELYASSDKWMHTRPGWTHLCFQCPLLPFPAPCQNTLGKMNRLEGC